MTGEVIRVGNASGFYGDRFSAMTEMLTGGELDYLTGDYLAELTMLILGRDLLKDPTRGYAKTFLRQLRENLALAKEKRVRIVANAGGLNPLGLADAVRALADELGVDAKIAHVTGDDLRANAAEFALGNPLTANAYLGAWGIVECLRADADVVITGRVTDASLVVGPAAAHFGWARDDYDKLAGAVVAGHVIECGPQATGGNFAFFTELQSAGKTLVRPGFPIAEVDEDGSSVITKHPNTDGAVTVGTITAQLLYEIAGARYPGPDVTARFDTITLAPDGDGVDRVRITGVRGEPPPPTLKVGMNTIGGFRNAVTFVLTGLDIDAKADLIKRQISVALQDNPPAELSWTLARTDHEDARTEQEASALLHCVARDADPAVVGRPFSSAAVELALASYPGFTLTAPPADAAPYGVFTSAAVDASAVPHIATLPDSSTVDIPAAGDTRELSDVDEPALPKPLHDTKSQIVNKTRRLPLGTIVGARSGDKGGSANLGVWVRSSGAGVPQNTDDAWRWLANYLTVDELRRLLPETAELD
ncbi:MAG: DUF1446 domain-containing protein, partial [Sciscionella sp.]|nr:DUF1446 domain-containing protein [Sciscionella sp.]